MEKFGYFLSELPVLFLIVWFAVRWLQYRRLRRQEPLLSPKDRVLFFGKGTFPDDFTWLHLAKLLFVLVVASQLLWVEIYLLKELGAAILSVTVLFSVAGLVYRYVITDK